jgi:hypothetical protein
MRNLLKYRIGVERQNLTTRPSMRRFTCLTNPFSKKLENCCHALARYFVFYDVCRVHKTSAQSMVSNGSDHDVANPGPAVRGLAKSRSLKFQIETLLTDDVTIAQLPGVQGW